MLSHCANPQCSKPFLHLREGRLFMVETDGGGNAEPFPSASPRRERRPPRHVERYWLCDQCATAWTLMQDRSGGIALVPLSRAPARTAIPIQGYRGGL